MEMKKHEIDRQAVESLPSFTKKELKEVKKDLENFVSERARTKYFMLLSNDINYYTIFEKSVLASEKAVADKIFNFLTEDSFLKELGELKALKRTGANMEIWIGETYFLLFDADSFIVSI